MTTNSIVSGVAAITAICVSVAIAPVCHADDGEEARDLLMAVDVAFRKDASLAESEEEGKGLRSGLASRLREAFEDVSGSCAPDQKRAHHTRCASACREGAVGASAFAEHCPVGVEARRRGAGKRNILSALRSGHVSALFADTECANSLGRARHAPEYGGSEIQGTHGT